jgi:hypothetical protein
MYLRRLDLASSSDQEIAAKLFLDSPDFELEAFSRLPSSQMTDPLSGRFPEASAPEHRLTMAAFEGDDPIALVQIARNFPDESSAAILMLVVPHRLRRHHVGCEIVERLSKQARRWPGISRWYITVVESNVKALSFWRHCGFRTTSSQLGCKGFADTVAVMVRPIKARPVCHHGRPPESPQQVTAQHLFARLT